MSIWKYASKNYWNYILFLFNWNFFLIEIGLEFTSVYKAINKGNNKITELRTILQRESQNSQLYKQTKSVNNRKTVKTVMTLTWHRHLQRNGGLNQIPKRQTSPFITAQSLRLV